MVVAVMNSSDPDAPLCGGHTPAPVMLHEVMVVGSRADVIGLKHYAVVSACGGDGTCIHVIVLLKSHVFGCKTCHVLPTTRARVYGLNEFEEAVNPGIDYDGWTPPVVAMVSLRARPYGREV